MSPDRQSRLRRIARRRVEEEPQAVVAEMESATQRLRDQAWKINATTRTPLIPDEAVRPEADAQVSAESE
jgi:hypothetical protein